MRWNGLGKWIRISKPQRGPSYCVRNSYPIQQNPYSLPLWQTDDITQAPLQWSGPADHDVSEVMCSASRFNFNRSPRSPPAYFPLCLAERFQDNLRSPQLDESRTSVSLGPQIRGKLAPWTCSPNEDCYMSRNQLLLCLCPYAFLFWRGRGGGQVVLGQLHRKKLIDLYYVWFFPCVSMFYLLIS